MLRTGFTFTVITILVGCTSTPILPTEQTDIEESPIQEITTAEPTPFPPEPTISPTPTKEPTLGELLWTFKPGSVNEHPVWVSPVSSAIVSNGILYVSAYNGASRGMGSIHALDSTDGTLLWSYHTNDHTSSTPTLAGSIVYFSSEDYNIYAVDALDGNLIWSYTTEGQVRTKPAVAGTMVFAKSQDGYLYALDAKDGSLQWRFQYDKPVSDIASRGSVPPSPAVDDGAVFVVGSDNILRAIDISDGMLRWEFDVGSQVFGSPWASDGIVYVGSLNHNLYALNASDGSLLWSHRTNGAIVSMPVVDDGRIFVSSNVVSAFDALSGKVLWEYDPDTLGSLGSPAIEGSRLYVSSFGGQLFAIDKDHGVPLAVYDLDEEIGPRAPGVFDGVMYVIAKDRALYAVKMIE